MRIMSVDPSLVNLGYAYGEINDGILEVHASGTFLVDKYLNITGNFNTGDIDTDRQLAVEHFLNVALANWMPVAISGESSFYNGLNPNTIIKQSKGLGLIERVLRSYITRNKLPFELELYTPNSIKGTLGLTKDEFKDKDKINLHINKHILEGDIKYLDTKHLPENQLDHANDAVAMMYKLYTRIINCDLIELNEEA